jgi:hypothetical protein
MGDRNLSGLTCKFCVAQQPNLSLAASLLRFLDQKKLDTQSPTHTPGRSPLDE